MVLKQFKRLFSLFLFLSILVLFISCGGGGSSSGGFVGDKTAPTIPTNLKVTTVSPRQINISWDWSNDATGVKGYKIYRNGTLLKSVTDIAISDTELSPSTEYCYTVSAYDAANNESSKSTQACATTFEGIPPTTPTNLIATAASGGMVNLSWDAATDNIGVAGYKVYRNGILLTSVPGITTTDVGPLNSSTEYCYTVSAYDNATNESSQSTQACAKTFFTKELGSSSYDYGQAVATDSSGNVYLTGYTSGGIDGNTNAGGYDIFVVKYNAAGIKQWTRQLGTSMDDAGQAIATDTSGNVYVTGYSGSGLDGGTTTGYRVMFLVKYDTSGTKQWTRVLGSTSMPVNGKGIAIDPSGNIYVAGTAYESLDGNTYWGDGEIFLVKYNAAGTKQWTRQMGTRDEDAAMGIALDTSGNIYITGTTKGNLDGNTNSGDYDIFLAKYNPAGTKQWTKQLGTSSIDIGYGIAVDASDNVYVTGVTFNGLDGNSFAGARDIFLVRYSTAGIKQWTRQLGTSYLDEGYGVAVDNAGNIYITGCTDDSLDGNIFMGSFDVVLSKYNITGIKQWTRQLGTSSADVGYGIAIDGGGNIYVTGQTDGNLGSHDGYPGGGSGDVFLAKYNTNGVLQ